MKKSLFFIGLAIALSIIALVISLVHVTPFEVTEETYIGTMVSGLGVCATFILGWQIYNVIAIKDDLKELRKEVKDELTKQKKSVEDALMNLNKMQSEIDNKHHESEEGLYYVLATSIYNPSQKETTCLDAINHFHKALVESVKYDSTNRDLFLEKLNELVQDINEISWGYPWSLENNVLIKNGDPQKNFQSAKDLLLKPLQEDTKDMEKYPDYRIIKKEHQKFLKDLNERFDQVEKEIRDTLTKKN